MINIPNKALYGILLVCIVAGIGLVTYYDQSIYGILPEDYTESVEVSEQNSDQKSDVDSNMAVSSSDLSKEDSGKVETMEQGKPEIHESPAMYVVLSSTTPRISLQNVGSLEDPRYSSECSDSAFSLFKLDTTQKMYKLIRTNLSSLTPFDNNSSESSIFCDKEPLDVSLVSIDERYVGFMFSMYEGFRTSPLYYLDTHVLENGFQSAPMGDYAYVNSSLTKVISLSGKTDFPLNPTEYDSHYKTLSVFDINTRSTTEVLSIDPQKETFFYPFFAAFGGSPLVSWIDRNHIAVDIIAIKDLQECFNKTKKDSDCEFLSDPHSTEADILKGKIRHVTLTVE